MGIRNIAVIGEGKMGSSIFYSLLSSPYTLRWIGSQKSDIENLRHHFIKRIRRSFSTGLISEEKLDSLISHTLISANVHQASDCDLVIEAIPEELTLKLKLFEQLDQITPSSCILASNSSSINPSKLFTKNKRDEAIIGMHYFFPVQLKETVELVTTFSTSKEVRKRAIGFLIQTNKQILHLNESNSFILNRLFLDIQNESYRIVEVGKASEQQIDVLVKEHLFPFGIFEFMDIVGIDTMLASITNYIENYPNRDYYSGLVNRLQGLVETGRLGVKTGHGFYSYEGGLELNPQDKSGLKKQLPADFQRSLIEFLRFTFLNTAKRFTMQSGCTLSEMNRAIKEYFAMDRGPFG